MSKRSNRAVFRGGVTHNSLVVSLCRKLINRIFDKKSNSNILHGYKIERHHDIVICSLAPCDSAEQNNLVNCFTRGGLGRGGKKKAAFTLAEVLITLGVIGVVAAMTIPTLISKIQKQQIESQIRENYSSIAQVMKMAENDDIGPVNIDLSNGSLAINKKWFETYIVPYMKVEQVCYSTGGCWHKYGVVKTLNGVAPIWETKVGISDSLIGGIGYALAFRTAKGSYFDTDTSSITQTSDIFGVDSTDNSIQFYFDVNGDRKPNIIGKDIYILVYDSDRGLIPAGFDRTKEEVKENCESGNGYWCLGYVKDNGWKIPDSVWKRTK